MEFIEQSVKTAVKGLRTASPFMQSVLKIPLCRDCKRLLEGFFRSAGQGQAVVNVMRGQKSEFDRMAMKTLESCSLCFCMWHLLPFDLPQSTSIHVIIRSGHPLDYAILTMWQGLRILGFVNIDQLNQTIMYKARNPRPLPTMDLQAISHWIRECKEHHLHRNWDLPRYQVPTSIQLIDVKHMMIISATTQHSYLALSYVWGEHDSFATTSKTRNSLGKKGGLKQYMNEIPQTIKDSIDVVRELGERYLWVDRLCIEQDNATQKEAHTQKMDVIYSQALVTIIAYAGVAATSPLPGVRPGTRLRLPKARIGDIVISTEAPGLWCSDVPHEKRGWTLQEQMLSTRCLYFDYHTTWFQCPKGACKEDRPLDLISTPSSCNMHDIQFSLADIMREDGLNSVWNRYVEIVERYRDRELSYAEDMVYAIQGVAQIISNSLETPLISAVPLKLLPRALQFYFEKSDDYVGGRLATAPSWSWAGWKTPITFESCLRHSNVSAEAIELDMRFHCRPHSLIKPPNKGISQSAGSELEDATENPSVPSSLYILLDIEAWSTNAWKFTVKSNPHKPCVLYVYDQRGACCGHSLGLEPFTSEEHYHSDEFRWILVSRSQPIPLSRLWAFEDTQRPPWSTRDIMLIRWSEGQGFWERVCVAHVQQEAWDSACPKVIHVLLG